MNEHPDVKREQYNADKAKRPYRGSKIVPVRLSEAMLASIVASVNSANLTATVRSGEPYSVSTWIRKAIEEKLSHLQRSRGGRGAKRILESFRLLGLIEPEQYPAPRFGAGRIEGFGPVEDVTKKMRGPGE